MISEHGSDRTGSTKTAAVGVPRRRIPPRGCSLCMVASIGMTAIAISGCAVSDDGPRTTRTRHVGDFTQIDNRDSVDVRLQVGQPLRVRVRAGRNVIADVHTQVRDGILQVTFDHDGIRPRDVFVDAPCPD